MITRDPLVEGTADYTSMMTLVDQKYAEVLPDFPKDERMFTTKQGSDCQYYF